MRSHYFLFLNLSNLSEHYNPLMVLEKFDRQLAQAALSLQSPFIVIQPPLFPHAQTAVDIDAI